MAFFFFSSRRRHTRCSRDWSSDVCSSDLGPDCWEFLWREDDPIGKRVRRTAVIGTVQQYPTDVLARAAVNGLRIYINQDRNRRREQRVLVADLVDHYIQT